MRTGPLNSLDKHLALLGLKVKDKVTGFSGVAVNISFDIAGCVQALVVPEFNAKTRKQEESHWYDTKRLTTSGKAVMPAPTFDVVPGGQDLPGFDRLSCP